MKNITASEDQLEPEELAELNPRVRGAVAGLKLPAGLCPCARSPAHGCGQPAVGTCQGPPWARSA